MQAADERVVSRDRGTRGQRNRGRSRRARGRRRAGWSASGPWRPRYQPAAEAL